MNMNKTIHNILSGIVLPVLGIFLLAGCNYLDIVPTGTPDEKDAFATPHNAKKYLYSCYGYAPFNANVQSSLDFLTGDDIVTSAEHETYAHFAKGTYTPSYPRISYWNTLFTGIRYCYTLINKVDGVPGIDKEIAEDYKAQAEFLIGFFHYLMIQNYGPTIIVTEVEDVNAPVEDFKARSTMAESVAFTAKILDSAASKLPATRTDSDYGMATSVAAKAIKAKLMVLAASPLFNGYEKHKDVKNPDGTAIFEQAFDQTKWDAAYAATKEAVQVAEQAGLGLYNALAGGNSNIKEPTNMMQRTLRLAIIDKENLKETVWGDTRQHGLYGLQSNSIPYHEVGNEQFAYGNVSPTLNMMKRFYTANGLPLSEDPSFPNESEWWTLMDVPADYEYAEGKIAKFVYNREPRLYAWTVFHNGYYEVGGTYNDDYNYNAKYRRGNGKAKLVMKMMANDPGGRKGRNNNYSPSGFLNKRLISPLETPAAARVQYIHPYVTMADLYLLLAESAVEVGKLDEAKATLDKIRVRAGIPTVNDAWKNARHPEKAQTKEGLREIVRQERLIEMYMLNQNFWDLRRWLIAENTMGKRPVGLNISSNSLEEFWRPAEVDVERSFRVPANYLMPIPQSEINKNGNLVQNPGY